MVRLRIGWCIYIYISDHYGYQEIPLQRSAAYSVSSDLLSHAPRRQDVSFVGKCERFCEGQYPRSLSRQEISLQRSTARSVSSVFLTHAPRKQAVSFVGKCERCCGEQDPGQQTRRSILRSEHSRTLSRASSSSPILENVFTCCVKSRIRSSW